VAELDRLCRKLTVILVPIYQQNPFCLQTGGLLFVFFALLLAGCNSKTLPSLTNPQASSEALALAVLDALRTEDIDQLGSLALNGQEFRDVVWPELPSSRPERGLPVSYAWNDLNQKSRNALKRLVNRWGGRAFTLLGTAYDGETTHYETFSVHRETRLHLRDDNGEEHEVHLYGSTLVRGNEFKVFSFVVD